MSARRSISRAERMASLAVLAALCLLGAWLLLARTRLNPAVEVALRAPAPRAAQAAGQSGQAGQAESAPGTTAGEAQAGKPGGPTAMAGLAALLPDAPGGLKALAAAESFTPATLSDKIDGKAELYLAAGFAAMACRSYQAGSARIEASLYRMKSPEAAFSVLGGQRRPGSAASLLAKNAYLTENALFLTQGRDYLEFIADRAGVRPALETLARAVLAGLAPEGGENEAKAPQDLFPRAGLKADSIRLAVADAFGCQGLTNVYTAEYDASTGGAGGATAFLSRRRNAAEATALAKLYARFLADNGYAAQQAAGAPAGAQVFVMEGSVEIILTRAGVLAGVHDAPDLGAALKLAAALHAALETAPESKGAGKKHGR